ncbi:MAG: hypothetical protein IJ249_04560 [Paludibacteraceae bacterium]|nr:hypothetical protein [Paludibacteraceae bacterium]
MYGVGFGVAVFYERQYQSLEMRNGKIAVPLSFLYGLCMAELQSLKLRFFICQTVFDILDYRKKSRKSKEKRQKTCVSQKNVVPLRRKRKTGGIYMTALQLNADIYQNLAILSQDESMLEKAAKYIRKLAKQLTDDPTCMTKEEFFARVDEAEREIKEGKGITFTNKADMVAWLNSL